MIDPWNGEHDRPHPRLPSHQPDVIRETEDRWILRTTFYHADQKRGRVIRIPAGFCFDRASVPRLIWWLISPGDLGEKAPLLHDWIYRHAGEVPFCAAYTRREADDLFNEVMAHDNVQGWKRRLAYRAVRWRGASAWVRAENPMDKAA